MKTDVSDGDNRGAQLLRPAPADKPPVAPDSEKDLMFERREMVGWFDPAQLAGTGVKALLAGVFGAYADNREIQAALRRPGDGPPFHDYHEQPDDEMWFDFVADLGDGWDSTYTVARLLAEENLRVRVTGDTGAQRSEDITADDTLPRGRFLVLGGDQVYPTAKIDEYRDRFQYPYRFALPWVDESKTPPHLFAIPGNHDWYDGLTSFTRLFCQERWIGGWKTRQVRSYFALRLPHNWWLWGIDIQLNSEIDRPQLEYFQTVAKRPEFRGARVILCTGSPSWVATMRDARAYENLGHFENYVVAKNGGKVHLTLTGDLHHYCRYHTADHTVQKITAGGGGAYLYGTHTMPPALKLDNPDDDQEPVTYQRGPTTFPDFRQSRRLSLRGLFMFPFHNWKFSLLLGSFYALNAWMVQSASKQYGVTFLGKVSIEPLTLSGVWSVFSEALKVLAHSPSSVALSVLFVGCLIGFAQGNKLQKILAGGIHGLGHLALNISLCWIFARWGLLILRDRLEEIYPGKNFQNIVELVVDYGWQTTCFTAEILVVGSLLAGFLFSIYLVIFDLLFGLHTNEVFASQGIPHFKNFLRLHIDKTGRLRVYPIGISRVCRKWKFISGATDGKPFFEPVDCGIQECAELIEAPIEIGPSLPDPTPEPIEPVSSQP